VAAGPPSLRAALHAHVLLLDQPGGRWFAEIQRRCLDRGVFCSLEDLTTTLQDWIKLWNVSARPFKWTKTPDQIIDSICRYCARILLQLFGCHTLTDLISMVPEQLPGRELVSATLAIKYIDCCGIPFVIVNTWRPSMPQARRDLVQ
jgi:hypothetical protein